MRETAIPRWLYWPLKVLLVICIFSPFLFWFQHLIKLPGANDQTAGDPPFGIDVSHYQGIINWDKVGESQVEFAYAKATSGETYVDPHFTHNWDGIRASGIYRGAYHFFLADDDPALQAANFLKTVGKLREYDLPPMLDVEIMDHASKDNLEVRVLAWLKAVEKETGRIPILYTDSDFGADVLSNPDFSRYPLWVAEYSDQISIIPSPWKKSGWTIWQHSEKGQIPGIDGDVDLDRFNTVLSDIREFIENSKIK